MSYKQKTARFSNAGGKKERLRRVLTVIGNADTIEGLKPRKKTPKGYQ